SVLQPAVGIATDRKPQPYSLIVGMSTTFAGIVLLSQAGNFPLLVLASALIGIGSSIFHPEASRLARLASGGRHGFAQSLFQVGGNAGSSLGPLLAAWIIAPYGRHYILWFTLIAFAGMIILSRVGAWYKQHLNQRRATKAAE